MVCSRDFWWRSPGRWRWRAAGPSFGDLGGRPRGRFRKGAPTDRNWFCNGLCQPHFSLPMDTGIWEKDPRLFYFTLTFETQFLNATSPSLFYYAQQPVGQRFERSEKELNTRTTHGDPLTETAKPSREKTTNPTLLSSVYQDSSDYTLRKVVNMKNENF